MRVEALEDRRLLSIHPVSAVAATLAGDTAGALDQGHWAWTSNDGRWVAFTSDAPNLAPGEIHAPRRDQSTGDPTLNADVYLYDRQAGSCTLVSRQAGTSATTANGMSVAMGVSADGRFVLFRSEATNLIPGETDTNGGFDIFLYDAQNKTTQLVSHSSDSGQLTTGNGESTEAVLSADGSSVAFVSDATNLVSGVTDANNASDVFLWHRSTGAVTLVSQSDTSANTTANAGSRSPSISSDGSTVAFASDATDLVSGVNDNNGASDVFLYDAVHGVNTLVSRNAIGLLPAATTADGASTDPALSGDGQYVAYESLAGNLVAGQNGTSAATNVFLYSRTAGTSQLVSAAGGSGSAAGNADSRSPAVAVSADGQDVYVAFVSDATNLVPGQSDSNGTSDVFLFDRGVSGSSVSLVSHSSVAAATAANAASDDASISADGRFVAFSSQAGNLVPGEIQVQGNNAGNVFVYDRTAGTSQLLSGNSATPTQTGDGGSQFPVVSGDGSSVIYLTAADDLVAGKRDDNRFPDLVQSHYDSTQQTWTNSFVSLRDPNSPPPATANDVSNESPGTGQSVISADGRYVVFTSQASDLVAGEVQIVQSSVYLYDALTGQVQLISHAFGSDTTTGDGDSYAPTISADGRWVAFVSEAGDLVQNQNDTNNVADVFLFDRVTDTTELVSHAAASATMTGDDVADSPAISADGQYVAFVSSATDLLPGAIDTSQGAQVFRFDRNDGSIQLLSGAGGSATAASNGGSSDPGISADGSRVVFLSQATNLVSETPGAAGQTDAFLYDATAGSVQMVSRIAGSSTVAGNGSVVQAVLSANGNFVAFESQASNLVPGISDANNDSDIFLYRVADGALQLVSQAGGSSSTGDGGSANPALSADGRYLAFASSASNLVSGPTNPSGGIYLYDQVAGALQLVGHVSASAAPPDAASLNTYTPAISADGRFVTFNSRASDVVSGMVNPNPIAMDNIFRFDRLAGANELVSRTAASTPASGNSWSLDPSISADGRSVVFNTDASDLVAGDYNRREDVLLFRAGGLAANHAPSLNSSVTASLGTINEDEPLASNAGTTVDSLVGTPGLYSDSDGVPPAGIAVTGAVTANGTWWYSTDGGASWSQFGAVGDSSATLLAADGMGIDRVQFRPALHWSGTAALSFRAWDTSDGNLNGATGVNVSANGGSTAYSAQTATATISVQQVSDITPPTASLSAANVMAGATVPYTFTVTYTDDTAVSRATLGNGNIQITAPSGGTPTVSLVSVDNTSDAKSLTATYQMIPSGGTWNAANNGTYTISMQANQVTDTAGNPAAAGVLGTFTVDTIAPTASLSSLPNVIFAGSTSYTFTVTYADNIAVKASTLGNANLRVTGPRGFNQAATLVSVDVNADGTPRTATYRITPPGGKWTASANGAYAVSMQANQVTDTLGNPVAAGTLGTFTVRAARDRIAPRAALSASNVTTAGATKYFFTVTYTDNVEVNVSTLGNRNILVTGPGHFRQFATFDHVDPATNGTPRTATYWITPRGGSWGAWNNGVYFVTVQARQVRDTSGNFVAPRKLGRFTVDTAPPTASLAAPKVTKPRARSYIFTVKYTDGLAVNVSTLNNSDILVTGPNGFSQMAVLVGVSPHTNGTPRTARYRIVPPGGSWDAGDNGVYTIRLQANQVADVSGNFMAAGNLGTFRVAVPSPRRPRAASRVAHPAATASLSRAQLAAAADAALSLAGPQLPNTAAHTVFGSLDDWLH